MYAYSAILTALVRRSTTGDGAALEVSMLDALGEWMSHPMYATTYGATALPRSGARHATIAPYGPFAAGDGGTVYLGIQNEREWIRFCNEALAQPALANDARFVNNTLRVEHRDVLEAAINAVFATLTTSEIVARLDSADIAQARLNTVEEFTAHPQLAARNRWRDIELARRPASRPCAACYDGRVRTGHGCRSPAWRTHRNHSRITRLQSRHHCRLARSRNYLEKGE